LCGLAFPTDANVLVGLARADDAGVYRVSDELALIQTVDFFTPIVDDPYEFGRIAAANALSDVYAMGGVPKTAMNLVGFPAQQMDLSILRRIIQGGIDTLKAAGVVLLGGHSVEDKELKYGLSVTGFVHPDRIRTKQGLMPGDRLVLTKPLGFGVTTTALKREQAAAEDVQEVVAWMKRLNRTAGELAVEFHLRGGTDVTGYSLLGHAWEMASASGVGLRLHFDSIPLTRGARKYAEAYTFPGGASDNREYFSRHVQFPAFLSENEQMLLFDPQTSGGLLLAVPPAQLDAFMHRAAELDQPTWEIGEVDSGSRIQVV